METVLQALARSPFRCRFRLDAAARTYVQHHGMETLRRHAEDFVRTRLAPAAPPNDGKQTPMRGHPVFLAQHACACCCRGCLAKWHGISVGQALTAEQQAYIVTFLLRWIEAQMSLPAPAPRRRISRRVPVQGEWDFGQE